jgi:hypothetical protein
VLTRLASDLFPKPNGLEFSGETDSEAGNSYGEQRFGLQAQLGNVLLPGFERGLDYQCTADATYNGVKLYSA